jgi:hypothetical protein
VRPVIVRLTPSKFHLRGVDQGASKKIFLSELRLTSAVADAAPAAFILN